MYIPHEDQHWVWRIRVRGGRQIRNQFRDNVERVRDNGYFFS